LGEGLHGDGQVFEAEDGVADLVAVVTEVDRGGRDEDAQNGARFHVRSVAQVGRAEKGLLSEGFEGRSEATARELLSSLLKCAWENGVVPCGTRLCFLLSSQHLHAGLTNAAPFRGWI
jgi:hypothetical protein